MMYNKNQDFSMISQANTDGRSFSLKTLSEKKKATIKQKSCCECHTTSEIPFTCISDDG